MRYMEPVGRNYELVDETGYHRRWHTISRSPGDGGHPKTLCRLIVEIPESGGMHAVSKTDTIRFMHTHGVVQGDLSEAARSRR